MNYYNYTINQCQYIKVKFKKIENDILVGTLDKNNISYKKQVHMNKSGIIVEFNEKKCECYHIIVFTVKVIIEVEKIIIINYKIIS
jgi:hypothetical protein